jgi:hypothetical protein
MAEKVLRNLSFVDAEGSKINVEIGIYERGKGKTELAISGRVHGGGAGQIYDEIKPANEAQAKLVEIWRANQLKTVSKKLLAELLEVADEIVALEGTNEDKGDFSAIDDDKIVALAQHLGLTATQAEKIKKTSNNTYGVGDGDFLVCTDDEATAEAEENIRNLVDDVGIESFNVNINDFVDVNWFRDAQDESNRFYVEDIENENDHTYGNRLIRELYDGGILTDEDFKKDAEDNIDYSEVNEEVDLDSKKEELIDKMNSDWKDPVDWYIKNFGDLKEVIKSNPNIVETDALAEYVVSVDGRGHVLNGYDGNEYEEEVNGTTYYIYES